MNRLFTFCTVAIFMASNAMAQEHQHGEWCGHNHATEVLKTQFPNMDIEAAEKIYRKAMEEKLLQKDGEEDDDVFIVPIVFHLLHNRGPENIVDAQIFDAVNLLNQHFRKLHPDTAVTIPEFQDIHADARIEFRLANKAPDGSCTNGINRIPTALTADGSARVKFVQWPRHVYLNIWVVQTIPSGAGGTTLGYAFKPPAVDDPGAAFLDGIVIRSDALGSIGTSTVGRSTTLTHEVGHYLNLDHPWGPTNSPGVSCGDDGIPDTPVSQGWTFCPDPSIADFCNPGIIENFQNFMDYSFCHTMFTEDQADWMRLTLTLDVANRSFLNTPGARAIAGIDQDEPTICSPEVQFFPNRFFACTNDEVTFTSAIANATAETYAWSFPGGEASSTDGPVAQVSYSTPGWKTVTLTAGNATGSDTRTEDFAIYIMPEEGEAVGEVFTENFSSASNLDNRWIIRQPNENILTEGVNWDWSPIGCLDPGSMKLNLFDSPTPEIYQFVSPPLNLEGKAGEFISFKYAYATQANPNDVNIRMRVISTSNCGNTSVARLTISEPSEIVTAGSFQMVPFEPNQVSQWRNASFQISNAQAVNGIQYIIEVESDFGVNNFYIDNFTAGNSLVSVEDQGPVGDINMYPNPTSGLTQLDIGLNQSASLGIRVFDLAGKQVMNVQEQLLPTGLHTVRLNTSSLAAGVYTVKVLGEGIDRSLKLVVQP